MRAGPGGGVFFLPLKAINVHPHSTLKGRGVPLRFLWKADHFTDCFGEGSFLDFPNIPGVHHDISSHGGLQSPCVKGRERSHVWENKDDDRTVNDTWKIHRRSSWKKTTSLQVTAKSRKVTPPNIVLEPKGKGEAKTGLPPYTTHKTDFFASQIYWLIDTKKILKKQNSD